MPKTYKDIEYYEIEPGKWRVIFPSRIKGIMAVDTEDELKATIDALEKNAKKPSK